MAIPITHVNLTSSTNEQPPSSLCFPNRDLILILILNISGVTNIVPTTATLCVLPRHTSSLDADPDAATRTTKHPSLTIIPPHTSLTGQLPATSRNDGRILKALLG